MKIKKVIINESSKFFRNGVVIFEFLLIVALCMIASNAYKEMSDIVVNHLPKSQYYSEEVKNVLIRLDGVGFSKLFLTDFIYKGYFSFFLIFTVILAVHSFSGDRESGNMKFTILAGVDRSTILIGKLIHMALVSLGIALFNVVLSLGIGTILFGVSSSVKEVVELFTLSILAALPAMALIVFMAIISQIRVSSKIVVAVGIIFTFIMGVLDTITITNKISPIGALSLFTEDVPVLNSELINSCLCSVVYIVIGVVIMKIISSKYEYYE